MRQGAGTTPRGTAGEQQAAHWVQEMFTGIAPKYDLLNHLLSFNIDRGWRRALVERLRPELLRADARVLDLCCGTGDVLLDLQSAAACQVIGADFCHPMLVAARNKAMRKHLPAEVVEADALRLPVADSALDGVSIAFGFRNLANYEAGLAELRRVLKPGGALAILEFSHPPGSVVRWAYGIYSKVIMPAVGSLVSGSREAYSYLPESIRKFPGPEALRDMMHSAGFADTNFQLLSGGIAALHVGRKLASDGR